VHTKRVNDDFSLWVDTGLPNRRTEVSPYVGIQHVRVNELCAALLGLQSNPETATASAQLGYVLSGQPVAWDEPTDAGEVLRAIAAGLSRLEAYLDLDALTGIWRDFPAMAAVPRAGYTQVTLQLIRGDLAQARRQLQDAERHYCADDPDWPQFREFERRFEEYVEGLTSSRR
jgi:hypothetical protein